MNVDQIEQLYEQYFSKLTQQAIDAGVPEEDADGHALDTLIHLWQEEVPPNTDIELLASAKVVERARGRGHMSRIEEISLDESRHDHAVVDPDFLLIELNEDLKEILGLLPDWRDALLIYFHIVVGYKYADLEFVFKVPADIAQQRIDDAMQFLKQAVKNRELSS